MSSFDEALAGFIATARAELGLQTSAQNIAYVMMDALRVISPESDETAMDCDALSDALESAAYRMTEAEHAPA